MRIKKNFKKTKFKGKKIVKKKQIVEKPAEAEPEIESESDGPEDEDVGFINESEIPEFDEEEEIVPELEDVDDDELSDEHFDDFEQQFNDLAKSDPTFYQYLVENDAKLLEFKQNEQEQPEEEDEEVEEEEDYASLVSAVKKYSVKALKKVLLILKTAINNQENVQDSKSLNLILVTALNFSPLIFDHQIHGNSAHKKYRKIQALIKSFLNSLIILLKQLTDVSMQKFILTSCQQSSVYFTFFPKVAKDYVKSAHNQFLQAVRVTNHHTWNEINFLINSLTELLGLHLPTAYQHMFVYIRELAVLLRNATTAKTKDSFKTIYNWQYLHSLRLWCKVLCQFISELQPLAYPTIQIIVGVLALKPTSKHFPFRLHLIKLLLDIIDASGLYCPVAAFLLEIFESNEFKSSKPSTLKPLDFTLSIKSPNSYLGTKTYQRGLIEEIMKHFYRFYSTFSSSIAFPELAVPTIIQLKRIIKHSKDFNLNKELAQLVEKLESNSKFIDAKRSAVSFGPNDAESVELFSKEQTNNPFAKYVAVRNTFENKAPKQDKVAADDYEQENEQKMEQDDQFSDDQVGDFVLSDEDFE